MQLSFLKPVQEVIFSHVTSLFPRVEQCICIVGNETELNIFYFQDDSRSHGLQQDNPGAFLQTHEDYYWYRSDEVIHPYDVQRIGNNHHSDLFEEMERNVLFLKLTYNNQIAGVFVFFDQNRAQLGFLGSDLTLSQDNKILVGRLTYNSLQNVLERMAEDENLFAHFRSGIQNLSKDLQQNAAENRQSVVMLEKMLLEFAREYIDHRSAEIGLPVSLTNNAREKVMEFRGSPALLKQMIDHAMILAMNLTPNSPVLIDEWNFQEINKTSDVKASMEENKPQVQQIYVRTWEWLNRLENAVQDVLKSNLPVTGANVGAAMKPSISAAAISDAMKKQEKFLKTLLLEYPQKWNALRTHFKPIRNKVEIYTGNVKTA